MFDNRRIIFILYIILVGAFVLKAQVQTDSTTSTQEPLEIVFFNEHNLDHGNRSIRDSIGYTLDSFQIVHPFLLSTGNLGAPGKPLFFQTTQADPFSVRSDAFEYFGFGRNNRRFYSTNQPYTLLQYFVGQRREQYVDVLHTRNFGDNMNFSFHFIRARSEGFYKRQNTSNTSVRSNLWFKSPGKRYSLMADFYWTGANIAENGGIANDSSFEFSNQIDRQVVAVNLENAGTIQRKRGVWVKHTFALGDVTDTLRLDSARIYNVITPAWGISVLSELSDEKYNYNDGFPQSGFYDTIYRDTARTADSTYCWRINNSVRLEKFDQNGKKKTRGYVGVRHEAGEYFNDTIYSHFQNFYAEGMAAWSPRKDSATRLSANGWYVLSGYSENNYGITINAEVPFVWKKQAIPNLKLFAVAGSVKTSAQQIYQRYSGNHQRWANTFDDVTATNLTAGFTYSGTRWLDRFAYSGTSSYFENWNYFDSTFLPRQHEGIVNVFSSQIYLQVHFNFLYSAIQLNVNSTKDNDVVRIPEYSIRNTTYANLHLFKRALQLQIGVDVTWFSEFTAEAYMPAVAQFYLQNQRMVGNYVYLDPWVSFRIKPVRVFVKAEHVNAGMMGRKYFLLDGYPHNDFALKIGISWLFSD